MSMSAPKLIILAACVVTALYGCGGKEERKAKYLERGKAYIAEENWDKARVEIKNVLQIDPKSAHAYYLMGQIEEKNKEWTKAFSNYSKAVELNPDDVEARSILAKFYLLQANVHKARDNRDAEANALGEADNQIKEVLKRDPDHTGVQTLKAAMLLREGEIKQAIVSMESLVKSDPTYGPAVGLLASMYEQEGRIADAERVLRNALGQVDEPVPLQLHLSRIYISQGKNHKAEEVLREIINSRPDEIAYRVQLAKFLMQIDQKDKAEVVMRDAVALDPDDATRHLMLADLLVAKGALTEALDYLRDVINKKPELAELRVGLASLYEKNNKQEEAKEIYKAMVKRFGVEPPGLVARNRLALHALSENDMDTASKLIDEVLVEQPRNNDALLMKGRIAMQQSDFETAVASFRAVLKDQPDSVTILHLLAEAQLRKGDMELAGDNLLRAVEVAPTNSDARIKYTRYLIARKDLVSALEQIDAVLAKEPNNIDAIVTKSEVLSAKGDLKAVERELLKLKETLPDNPEASLGLARLYIAQGDNESALAEIDSILTRDEANLSALLLKTEVLAAMDNESDLVSTINQLKVTAPDNPEGYFRMGRYLRMKGKTAEALKEFEQAYAQAEGSAKSVILAEIIDTHSSTGDFQIAIARLESLVVDNPEHPVAYGLLGRIHMMRDDYLAAESAYTMHAQINPNNPTAYAQLAAAREKLGNIDGAEGAYNQGLALLNENIALLNGLASFYERNKRYDDAIRLYEEILSKRPDNAIAVNNLAALLADHRSDQTSLTRARELAQKLVSVNNPAIQDTVGWVYYRTGDYAKSIEVLKKVVETAPEVSIFQFHLGMAYAKEGNKSLARNHLTRAIELGDFPGQEEAVSTLNSL